MYEGEDSQYLKYSPDWHEEDSPAKADQIFKLIEKNSIRPESVAEVGCGAGEILNQLHFKLPDTTHFFGYDIALDAINLAKTREKSRLQYFNENFFDSDKHFDLLLVIDVAEHVENYYDFLKQCRKKADMMILAIPLDVSVRTTFSPQIVKGRRDTFGHIHYFNANTALLALENCGFEVIDHFFVSISLEMNLLGRFARMMTKTMYSLFGRRWTADIIGSHTLYALVK
jgi:SAM-dependent methyltransferase